MVDEVLRAIRVRTVGQSRHRRHKVSILDVTNVLDELQLELVFADPRRGGEIDLKRWIRRLLLSNHAILELVTLLLMCDDVVEEPEEVGLAGIEERVMGSTRFVELRRFSLRKNFLWWFHHRL